MRLCTQEEGRRKDCTPDSTDWNVHSTRVHTIFCTGRVYPCLHFTTFICDSSAHSAGPNPLSTTIVYCNVHPDSVNSTITSGVYNQRVHTLTYTGRKCTLNKGTKWKAAASGHCHAIHYSSDYSRVCMHRLHHRHKYIRVHYCVALSPFGSGAPSGVLALTRVHAGGPCRRLWGILHNSG